MNLMCYGVYNLTMGKKYIILFVECEFIRLRYIAVCVCVCKDVIRIR